MCQRLKWRSVRAILAAAALLFVQTPAANACSCSGDPAPLCRAFFQAEMVFVATSNSIPPVPFQTVVEDTPGVVTVRAGETPGRRTMFVTHTFRGDPPAKFDWPYVDGLENAEYLFFAWRDRDFNIVGDCCGIHGGPLEHTKQQLAFIERLGEIGSLGTVAGKLTRPDGISVSVDDDWRVVLEEEDETRHETRATSFGYFELNHLRPGRYVLHVYHGDEHIPYTRALLVAPGACPTKRIPVPVVTLRR